MAYSPGALEESCCQRNDALRPACFSSISPCYQILRYGGSFDDQVSRPLTIACALMALVTYSAISNFERLFAVDHLGNQGSVVCSFVLCTNVKVIFSAFPAFFFVSMCESFMHTMISPLSSHDSPYNQHILPQSPTHQRERALG